MDDSDSGNADIITITGLPANVEAAKEAILVRINVVQFVSGLSKFNCCCNVN